MGSLNCHVQRKSRASKLIGKVKLNLSPRRGHKRVTERVGIKLVSNVGADQFSCKLVVKVVPCIGVQDQRIAISEGNAVKGKAAEIVFMVVVE